jgi:phage repressor protein C with HTH and peptisase S24 domain
VCPTWACTCYLSITKQPDGRYVLKAANPDYPDLEANEEMRTLARLVDSWSEDD